jgi:hypothetical protein
MPIPQWMKADLALTDDEAKVLDPLLTEDRVKKLDEGHLRQADYSKKMNELGGAQTKLDEASTKLEAEIAEWATVQANGEQVTKKMREDMEAAQLSVTKLQQRVRSIATDAGMDPEKALEGINVVVKKADETPIAPDLTGYVKVSDLNGQLGSLASMALKLPAIFAKIGREHRALTGQDLDEQAIVTEIERRANTKGNSKSLDPIAIWEEQHAIPEKRTAAAKKQHDDEIAAAEARGREAAMSEASVPGQQPQGRHAPVFQTGGEKRESVLKRPQPGQTVNAAVSALRTGKYRTGGDGQKKTA